MMNTISTQAFLVNGKSYQPSAKPTVVICIDGSADEYLDTTMAFDRMPNLKKMATQGYRGMVRGALPSSLACGQTPLWCPGIHLQSRLYK